MQVIIVITDVEDEYQEEKNGQVAYSVFEKPQLHEKGLDIQWSPAMQIGATLSAFLRMIEENHALLETCTCSMNSKKNTQIKMIIDIP